jgi:Family of unknown function (DUF6518)
VAIALTLLAAALFGGGDQYLGSLAMHPWMIDVSMLSAPWLVLAFVAGSTQREARRAAWLGLGSTFAALMGYGAMTLSPVENAHYTTTSVVAFVVSESGVLIGGVLTGPLFGWFGQRWRAHRAWRGALATAALVCLEPLVRDLVGHAIHSPAVLLAEVAAGLLMIAYVATSTLTTAKAK